MEEFISLLYLCNVFITIFAYLPQIIKLERMKSAPENFSVVSWVLWSYVAFITLLYGAFVLYDLEMIIVWSLTFTLIFSILVIILYKKIKYRSDK